VADAVTNTSPLLFLHALDSIAWLEHFFQQVMIPSAVAEEMAAGVEAGLPAPSVSLYRWLRVVEPSHVPPAGLTTDLGAGELAVIALALDAPNRVVLLDDARARRLAKAAGLTVWGTLRVLLEAKGAGLTPSIASHLDQLQGSGMWLTDDVRRRVLRLAGE
jgi:predicted nucleic acid-binding protein